VAVRAGAECGEYFWCICSRSLYYPWCITWPLYHWGYSAGADAYADTDQFHLTDFTADQSSQRYRERGGATGRAAGCRIRTGGQTQRDTPDQTGKHYLCRCQFSLSGYRRLCIEAYI